jgi:O-antigen chain-terminating methyltransferase
MRDAFRDSDAAVAGISLEVSGLKDNAANVNQRIAGLKDEIEVSRGHVRDAFRDSDAAVARISVVLSNVKDEAARLKDETVHIKHDAAHLRDEAAELKDIRSHWAQWRQEWERKLSVNEVQFLRGLADIQAGFQYRSTQSETNFRETVAAQHRDFTGALERSTLDIQKRLWEDMQKVREEYERLIHNELRVIRQRTAAMPPAASPAHEPAAATSAPEAMQYDALRFADRFRGTEAYVEENQKFYLPFFKSCKSVLDIGCGRGEFLKVAASAGIPARGIDLSEESVGMCRAAGFEAAHADLFPYLAELPYGEIDGIFCGQVVEHLQPERLPEFIHLAGEKLARGGILAIETPNPECLAIFATHFYLDPTHTRPVPSPLLVFFLEEAGFGGIEVYRRFPAEESMPSVKGLPREFLDQFFGGLDYAVIARRL